MIGCGKEIDGGDHKCGDLVDDQRLYCSVECTRAGGKAELESFGITPDLMKEALDGYYECKDMITQRERDGARKSVDEESVFRSLYSSDQE